MRRISAHGVIEGLKPICCSTAKALGQIDVILQDLIIL